MVNRLRYFSSLEGGVMTLTRSRTLREGESFNVVDEFRGNPECVRMTYGSIQGGYIELLRSQFRI